MIFALATGPVASAVAIVRVSGAGCGQRLAALVGRLPPAREARMRRLRCPDSGDTLDEALVLWFPGPGSFSGEDALELHLHGGRAVVAAVSAALVGLGCRPAEPGEFSRRAFLNGRLDLTRAEGIADLIAAETEGQRRQALRQAQGGLADRLDDWQDMLTTLLAHQEASIEFAEDGIPNDLDVRTRAGMVSLRQDIGKHLHSGHRAERLRSGVRVAIIGPPNVGKSSLLNHLSGSQAAIVSNHPGTTRDVVEVRLDVDGVVVLLADTAGLRRAEDDIEAEGIRRALAQADNADLVLLMNAAGVEDDGYAPDGSAEVLKIWNKSDLSSGPADHLAISISTGAGLAEFMVVLAQKVAHLAGPSDAATMTRPRHRAALLEMDARLAEATIALAPELVAEGLRAARHALGRLTGRIGVEAVLDAVFRDFCIGK